MRRSYETPLHEGEISGLEGAARSRSCLIPCRVAGKNEGVSFYLDRRLIRRRAGPAKRSLSRILPHEHFIAIGKRPRGKTAHRVANKDLRIGIAAVDSAEGIDLVRGGRNE